MYFYLLISLLWSISESSKSILSSRSLLLLLLSNIPIDSRTWYSRIGVFQSTKRLTQSNGFQKNSLNLTIQNTACMHNKWVWNFSWSYFSLIWVLLKINVDISWSVITKCIKVSLMGTHFACENAFTKHLIRLLLILSGEQNPGPEKEKSHIIFCQWNLNGLMATKNEVSRWRFLQ